MTVKVPSSMLEVNKTRFLVQHESRERKCILNENLCNLKQKRSYD